MVWYAWLLIALCAVNPIVTIARIGAPRAVLTKTDAVASLVSNALYVWAIASLAS